MNMPKLSIVVPCWGVEKYLDRCIESLVNQTLKDIEIILVDDESPDRVPEICDEWGRKDSRIKVIHKKNGGLGFARNSGLEISTGEYVTFIDSDDYVELDTYETVYKKAKENNLDVCYFKHRRFYDCGIVKEVCFDKREYFFEGKDQVDGFMLNMIGKYPVNHNNSNFAMSVCMGIFKLASILDSKVKFISERTVASEDLIFHLNYLPHVHRIGVVPNVFYNYYVNTNSISTSFDEKKYHRMLSLLEIVKEELLGKFPWEKAKNHYYSQQLRIVKTVLRLESTSSQKSFISRLRRIKGYCKEPIFKDLYEDVPKSNFGIMNKFIVMLMKYQFAFLLLLIYRYIRKK